MWEVLDVSLSAWRERFNWFEIGMTIVMLGLLYAFNAAVEIGMTIDMLGLLYALNAAVATVNDLQIETQIET